MEGFLTEILVGIILLIVSGLGTKYLSKISKNVTFALTKINELVNKTDSIEKKVVEHQEIIEGIVRTKSTKDAIDEIVRDAYFYVHEDIKTTQLVFLLGEIAKDCADWYHSINFDTITCKEITVKYEDCSSQFRHQLKYYPVEFREAVASKMVVRAKAHTGLIIQITKDEVMNNKYQRFKIATELVLHDMIGIVIKAQDLLKK